MSQDAAPSAERPLRVGVVGVGVMGSNHARVFSGLPGTELVGVADPDAKQADFVARTLGCAAVGDIDALLDLGSTPSRSPRRRICIATSRSPASRAASTCWWRSRSPRRSQEGNEIIDAAQRAGVTLMVGHVERFNPAVEAIKEAIRNEDILSIAITRVGPFPPRMSNVGVVIDLAVHDIDLIRWFTDSDIVEVQPQLSSAVAEREDIALLQFRTASGVLAHINTNWLTPFKARSVTVATRRKYVMGDLLTRQVTECFGFQPDGSYSMRHLSVGHAEPLRSELLAFLRAVRTGDDAGGDRRGGRRQPRDRDPLPRARHAGGRTRCNRRPRASSPAEALAYRELQMNVRTEPPSIPFIDLAAQRRRLGAAVDTAVARVLNHCQFIMGPEVRALEAELAEFGGARHAVTCASGTDALVLALRALQIGPGDAVICPSFTFCATAEVAVLVGATPVFVDVDPVTFNIDVERHRRRGRDREGGGPHAEGDHPGRSVRAVGRSRGARRRRRGARPVHRGRCRARLRRDLSQPPARHLRRR